VPEVPTAIFAQDFGSDHPVAVVGLFKYIILRELGVKAWPPAVRIKLAAAAKQGRAASRTHIGPELEVLVVFAGAGVFGAFLA
jgi:hypothetical protein